MATAAGVMLACGFVGLKGLDLTRFALAEATEGRASLAAFRDTTGLRFAARSAEVALENTTARKIARTKSAIASAPLAIGAWLDLAELERQAGDTAAALRAFDMATASGPNEGDWMPARSVVGVSLWRHLGPARRRTAIADCLDGWRRWSPAQIARIEFELSGWSEIDKRNFVAALMTDKDGPEIARRLDLQGAVEDVRHDAPQRPGGAR